MYWIRGQFVLDRVESINPVSMSEEREWVWCKHRDSAAWKGCVVTRMYQHTVVALCMFSVFGNRYGWFVRDNIRLVNSFILLSADWPSDFSAEHAQCHFVLIHPRVLN